MPISRTTAARSLSTANRANGKAKRDRRSEARRAADAVAAAAAAVPMEALEARQHLSVSLDASGFTNVTPGAGSKVVYVSSSSGNDASPGTIGAPVRSIARAVSMTRSGTGDQVLLKRGDVWHSSLGGWTRSGASAAQPYVIGAYGAGARPTLLTGSANGMILGGRSLIHDLDIIGIHLDGSARGGSVPDGITSAGNVRGLLIEDCQVNAFRNNLTLQGFFGPIYNVTIRRSVVTDSYCASAHSQGLYADNVHGLTLADNVFDHNGWGHGTAQTMFNHNVYVVGTSSGLVATDNIFSNASSHGLQARPGGIVENNLFLNNAIGLSFGLVNGSGTVVAGGVTGTISNNVFVGGHSINGLPAGIGVQISNIKKGVGATLSNNLFMNGDRTAKNPAIQITASKPSNVYAAVGVNDLRILNNAVYNWYSALNIGGLRGATGPYALTGLVQSGNNFTQSSRNLASAAAAARSVAGYAAAVGAAASSDGFLAKARTLSRTSWNPRLLAASVVNYLKAGLGNFTASPVPVVAAPQSDGPPPVAVTPSAGTPGVAVGDVALTEGNAGYKYAAFTVKLSAASSKTVAVSWQTKGITAQVGSDYLGAHGTLFFAPGQTVKTVLVGIKGDRTREANEVLTLQLTAASGAAITRSVGDATIVNDD